MNLKKVIWLANTRDKIKDLPIEASQALGKSLLNVQLGIDPVDWKSFPQIGSGTIEIRVHRPDEYRLLYVARFPEAIYVLHIFQKKTQRTPEKDIQLARQRYGQLQKERKNGTKVKEDSAIRDA